MARVPAKMYRKITQHSYTRRKYMGGVPALRILQFQSGNKQENFPVSLHLITEEEGQVRHTALESMRITAVRWMDKKAGRDNYFLQVRPYPHEVLRQNKQASGAGADRVSMGMRLSFGKAIGTAARVAPGQPILTIRTYARALEFAKEAMRKAQSKIAMPCHVDIRSRDARSIDEIITVASKRGDRALSGAGTDTAEIEAELREEAGLEPEEPEPHEVPDEELEIEEGEEPEEGAEEEESEASEAEGAGDPPKGQE